LWSYARMLSSREISSSTRSHLEANTLVSQQLGLHRRLAVNASIEARLLFCGTFLHASNVKST
jgi:hypothetical protein